MFNVNKYTDKNLLILGNVWTHGQMIHIFDRKLERIKRRVIHAVI